MEAAARRVCTRAREHAEGGAVGPLAAAIDDLDQAVTRTLRAAALLGPRPEVRARPVSSR